MNWGADMELSWSVKSNLCSEAGEFLTARIFFHLALKLLRVCRFFLSLKCGSIGLEEIIFCFSV